MDQERFNYLLSMQTAWANEYQSNQKILKEQKYKTYVDKRYYSNSKEYQRAIRLDKLQSPVIN